MAEAAVSAVVKSVGSLLREETAAIGDVHVQHQIRELEAELKRMLCFLRDADAKSTEEDIIGQWVLQVKDIAYDVEDLLESYAFNNVRSRRGGGLGNVLKRCACILNDVSLSQKVRSEMDRYKTKISDLRSRFQSFGIQPVDEASSSGQKLWRRRTKYSFLEDEDIIVGQESDADLLVKYLVGEDKYRIVSILGLGGMGKTTLARKVYHHRDVRRNFSGFAWVFVSQSFEPLSFLTSVVKQLAPEEKVFWEEYKLISQLCTIQKQRRCLIVLDDMWSTEPWDYIKPAFPNDRTSSKILVTTRMPRVAGGMDFVLQPHILTAEQSWELFQRKALHGDMDREKAMFGKSMVKFCGGLPLALVVLAGILSDKDSLSEWEKVYRNIKNYSPKEDMYSGEGVLHWIFSLAYKDLPSPVKQCFLYLGSFPEDIHGIKTETLYQRWIAEGLVLMEDLETEQESMMDLAETYLSELAARGMVQLQISDVPKIRKFDSCRLHDIMRDLSLSKASEEHFLHYWEAYGTPPTWPPRRLVIDWRNLTRLTEEMTEHLRILQIVNPYSRMAKAIQILYFYEFNNFGMLRVLSLVGVRPIHDLWKLPKSIGNLLLLRYLSLKDSSIVTLPSSLTNLKHLQTLDLRVFKLQRLPNILSKMAGLTYLYLPSSSKLDPQPFKVRLDGLSKLEILENFNDQFYDTNDLPKLTNLQVLVVDYCFELGNLAMIADYVSRNNRLKHVSILADCDFTSNMENGSTILHQSLFGSKIHCFHSQGAISKFPGTHESSISSSLVQLSMNLFGLKQGDHDDVMGTLEKLMNLRTLCLWKFEAKEMIFHSHGFPQLRILRLFSFLNMKKWVVEETAMPNLFTLSIWGFTALEMVPDGLRFITTLRELDIRNMPEKFKARIRTKEGLSGEDFEKIRHVPSVLDS